MVPSSEGLCTSRSPFLVIAKTPTSEVLPYLFLALLNSLCSDCSLPSMYSTVSTICSRVRGPATSPALVTCPDKRTTQPDAFASCTNSAAQSRTCPTDPMPPDEGPA
eukprot:CAMPEP_0173336120 /NCGR_PEP_ID=MMETSP1144-20121109/6360_1 /TAXON_ID=483371 /ORGANISM="non described non described, Strain CCMP2298" /LENGTH=106 /DNA_ID=CAMNT_0014281337 /DNA_START=77 /DNA_END=397 /DNA_ORIENTATION=+